MGVPFINLLCNLKITQYYYNTVNLVTTIIRLENLASYPCLHVLNYDNGT